MKVKIAFAMLFISTIATACHAAVTLDHLRCEYLTNPLGIDVVKPRLSWTLQSEERGQKQTAYQVLAASSRELLAADRGDLWDSGRVESDQSIHVEYAGRPLASREQCFWKVRAWDKDGKPSAWSRSASWTMGLLKPEDWSGAKWIAYSNPAAPPPATPHNGYHSVFSATPDVVQWVAIDLGKNCAIDAVRLHPARPPFNADDPDALGYLFPVRFKIETAQKADFSDARVVVDRTAADVPNPQADAPLYCFKQVVARHVRLTVARLGHMKSHGKDAYGLALAEMQVFSGKKNVAKDAVVTAKSTENGLSIFSAAWSKAKLVDGRLSRECGVEGDQMPSTLVRKEFDARGPIKRAVVSVTGLGLYELRVNGCRVGDRELAPEWTLYRKRIQYQTYDVTGLLRKGKNAVAAQMGGGWWTGPLQRTMPFVQMPRLCLLLRLDVELANGVKQTIVTDSSWLASEDGPIRRSGIYFGETYDAAHEMPGWDKPGFAASGWLPVQTLPCPAESENAVLAAQPNEPIRVVKELRPVKMTEPKRGVYVFDMGQNMVGWCRLKADAPKGTKITVRHAEMLNDDGTIYTANLRGAAAVNEYAWPGGEAAMEPHFTYHGFRYVEVTGLPKPPTKDAVVGRVFHSAAPTTGVFSCSNDLLNKIMRCIEWTQRANMMSVPTDCPQRSERLGWMGDAQIFSQTAIYNRDMGGFFSKWVVDMRDSQDDNGRFSDASPHTEQDQTVDNGFGSPAWADAGVIVPWRMYQNYADKRMLAEHFESVKRWIHYCDRHNPNHLWQTNHFIWGDWLSGDETKLEGYPQGVSSVAGGLFATAFFAHSTEIVGKMARALGRDEDAARYEKLFSDIKAAFNKAFVAADGRIQGDTQAGYALALHFNLLDASLRPKAMEHLLEAIHKYKDHPSTGIQSTHRMILELTRGDHHDDAYRLMTLRTVPSWGYMVEMGATTIWERWDGYVRRKGGHNFQNADMNSFNHCAFGAVGEWVWRNLAGINPDDRQPGYQHFTIRPRPVGDLTWVKSHYNSIHGPIVSDWKIAEGRFHLHVEVPANTTATVYVPAQNAAAVTESGKPVAEASDVKFVKTDGAAAVFTVESGSYDFAAPN